MLVKKQSATRASSLGAKPIAQPHTEPARTERFSEAFIRRSRTLDIKIDRALKEAKQRLDEAQGSPRK